MIINTLVGLRRLLPAKFKKQSVIVILLLLLNSLLELAGLGALIPVIMAVLQDDAFNSGFLKMAYEWSGMETTQSFMMALCIVIFVVLVAKNIFSLLIQKFQANFAFEMYCHFATKMQRFSYSKGFLYFKSENSSYIVRDINQAPLFLSQFQVLAMLTLFTEIIILLIIVVFLFFQNPVIVLILGLLVGPIFLIFYRMVKNKITVMAEDIFGLVGKTNANLYQSIFGYVDVMMNNKKDYFFNVYKENVYKLKKLRTMQFMFNLMPSKVIETAMILGVLSLVLYGVYYLERKEHLELLALFALAAYKTLPSINKMLIAVLGIKSYNYVINVIEKAQHFEEIELENKPLNFEKEIELKNVNFTYDGTEDQVLTDINFKVNKGQSVGFIGRSGSGKTTLANLLLGFLKLNEGKILIDGVNLTEEHLLSWRELVGYVQQEVFLIDGTLAENIALGIDDIDRNRLVEVAERASLNELIADLPDGFDTKVGERGSMISGGQRQRVGIARALYSGAKILFFDEATSALDNETENEITEAINHLADGSLTMFIIAHRHSTLKYCDFIVELKDGKMEKMENNLNK